MSYEQSNKEADEAGICYDCPDSISFKTDLFVEGGINESWDDDIKNAYAAREFLGLPSGTCPNRGGRGSKTGQKLCLLTVSLESLLASDKPV